MKLKYAVSLIALSVASTSALAASQSTGQGSSMAFQNQQLAAMTNDTGVLPAANWFNHIGVSGLLNLDVFGQTQDKYLATSTVTQGSQSAFNVSTLALNLDSQINSWVAAHIGLFYATRNQPAGISGADNDGTAATRYYPANETGGANSNINGVDVDDAYVDIMNLSKAPVDFRVGRQYFAYGSYDRYAMMPTLTQQMTEVRGTGAQLAYMGASGLHAAGFIFRGVNELKSNGQASDTNQIGNGGATIGYTGVLSKLGFDVSLGYIYAMQDVGAFAQYTTTNYNRRTAGWDGNFALMVGPFKAGIQYAAAMNSMRDFIWKKDSTDTTGESAEPTAGNIYGSFAFKTAGYNSKLTASYQWSTQGFTAASVGGAERFTVPENRGALEYDVNVLQNTMVGLEINRDNAYSKDNNGQGDGSTTGIARLSILL
ncbi:MAG: hypothetical protein CMF39_04565 [Legionellaceae bacterium]|nr:hypothetical protein [Legionellaceae bacterium]